MFNCETVNVIGEGIVPGSSPSAPTGGLPLVAVNPASGTKSVQIMIGSNLPSEPMELGSVPFAYYAERALNVVDTITAAELPPAIATDVELVAAIAAEVAARTGADTTLQDAITAEAAARAGADTTLQTNITNEASSRSTADSGLQGQINNVQSQVNSHETRILSLEGGPSFNQISGQISEAQVPQYMRPFAFGIVSYDGSSGNNWPLQSGSYNVSNSSGSAGCASVTFQTAASTANYVVQVSSSPLSSATSYFKNKSTSGFEICVSSVVSAPEMDFVVFGNF